MARFVRAPRRLAAWLRAHRPTLRWPLLPQRTSSLPLPSAPPASRDALVLQHLPPRVALAVRRSQRARAHKEAG